MEPTKRSADDGRMCLVCAFAMNDAAAVPCAHDGQICATCVVKITRHLAAPRCCPFCKSAWPDVVFRNASDAVSYNDYSQQNLVSLESIGARAVSADLAAKYSKLLTFHCVKCDQVGVNFDFLSLDALQAHLKRKHHLQFCMVCALHRKAFVGELRLFNDEAFKQHNKHGRPRSNSQPAQEPHPTCDFCRTGFFGSDELFNHMEREHYHCHFCFKRGSDPKKIYEKTYQDLEAHFRSRHFLCDDQQCRLARFVAFPTELELKAHRLSVHSGSLTQKEKRAMGNVQVDLVYRTPGVTNFEDPQSRNTPTPAMLPIHDQEEFPSASTSTPTTSLGGWGVYRRFDQPLSGADAFPSLQQAHNGLIRTDRIVPQLSRPDAPLARSRQSNHVSQNRNPPAVPKRDLVRPVNPIPGPCPADEAKRRNKALITKMKKFLNDGPAYRKVKEVSQDFLCRNDVKAADFLAFFIEAFGGLSLETQDILEELIALLPEEGKRQALFLVYRAQVEMPRTTPNSSSRVASTHHPTAPERVPTVSERVQQANNASSTPSQAPLWVTSHPSQPSTRNQFNGAPPTMDSFPCLSSVGSAIDAVMNPSDEYHWTTLLESVHCLNVKTIQLPAVVARRLEFAVALVRDSISVFQDRFASGDAIPVTASALRRSRNQARTITVSDLDLGLPLNNLGVAVHHITQLQVALRLAQNAEYSSVRQSFVKILTVMSAVDLYILVDFVVTLFSNIKSGRERSVQSIDASSVSADILMDTSEPQESSRKHRKSKKRTLVQFG
uniref:RING-type domain-containing protein n=1 Tax=Spongospora subterranea TaxID=70186 RepID=A0A0H5RNX3_9EUKA|eukprot:CRZ10414.1 hypothetical protein [Spongospora subterranea]